MPLAGGEPLLLLALGRCPLLLDFLGEGPACGAKPDLVGFVREQPCDLGGILAFMEAECRAQGPDCEAALACGLASLLIQFGRHFSATAAPACEGGPLLADVLRYLEEHCATVTLGDAAARFGRHPNTLAALLKRGTGRTYCELVRAYRMELAAQLLSCGGLAVDRVAQRCGYANLGNFYQVFKRYWGMTPGEYARQARAAC